MATKPSRVGGGAKGLNGRAIKKRTFFAASLIKPNVSDYIYDLNTSFDNER